MMKMKRRRQLFIFTLFTTIEPRPAHLEPHIFFGFSNSVVLYSVIYDDDYYYYHYYHIIRSFELLLLLRDITLSLVSRALALSLYFRPPLPLLLLRSLPLTFSSVSSRLPSNRVYPSLRLPEALCRPLPTCGQSSPTSCIPSR